MIKNLTFTAEGNSWVAVEQLTGDCMLEILFPTGDNNVYLGQSIDGVKFGSLATESYQGEVFNTSINGVIPGMFLRIRTTSQPTSGKLLVP